MHKEERDREGAGHTEWQRETHRVTAWIWEREREEITIYTFWWMIKTTPKRGSGNKLEKNPKNKQKLKIERKEK